MFLVDLLYLPKKQLRFFLEAFFNLVEFRLQSADDLLIAHHAARNANGERKEYDSDTQRKKQNAPTEASTEQLNQVSQHCDENGVHASQASTLRADGKREHAIPGWKSSQSFHLTPHAE